MNGSRPLRSDSSSRGGRSLEAFELVAVRPSIRVFPLSRHGSGRPRSRLDCARSGKQVLRGGSKRRISACAPLLPTARRGARVAEIVFDGVTKVFEDGTDAVSELNLKVEDGEFMVLVGPSGCGKTTALRMVAGLEEVTAGDVTHRRPGGQRRCAEGPGHRDGVPELRAVPAYDRVREHGVRAASCARLPKADINGRVHEAAQILELDDLLDASRGRCPAASASGSRWAARSFASRRPS